jgi:branched-chain amino acid transport system permease protein
MADPVDTRRVLRKSHVVLLLAAMVIFPFVAANFGNSWVRIMDMALLYVIIHADRQNTLATDSE